MPYRRPLLAPLLALLAACGNDWVSTGWPEEETRTRLEFATRDPVVVVGDSVLLEVLIRNPGNDTRPTVTSRRPRVVAISSEYYAVGVRPGTALVVAEVAANSLAGPPARDSTWVTVVPR